MADSEKIKNEVKNKAKRKVKSKVKRKAKSKAKKIHPLTYVICFLCLALGVGAGIGGYSLICRNDTFRVRGEANYVLKVGEQDQLTYKDEGVKIIEFGRDISDKVLTETNLTETDDGKYTVDTSKEGSYYIIYTVDSPKYGKVERIRTITVRP